MKLSTKCRYGVRAMIEIGHHYGKGALKRKDITRTQGISHGYLENILIALKTHGLIRTTRGAKGGFVLDRPPSQVTMLQIVEALEGSLAPVDCLSDPTVCARAHRCVARTLWRKLHDAQVKVLSEHSLQDLLDADRRGVASDYVI